MELIEFGAVSFKTPIMNFTERRLVESYTAMFEGLSSSSKLELIETLNKSLKNDKKTKEEKFFNSFGGFASEKSAEEILKDIRASRKFRKKEIKL